MKCLPFLGEWCYQVQFINIVGCPSITHANIFPQKSDKLNPRLIDTISQLLHQTTSIHQSDPLDYEQRKSSTDTKPEAILVGEIRPYSHANSHEANKVHRHDLDVLGKR
jgi:hypothetical protein